MAKDTGYNHGRHRPHVIWQELECKLKDILSLDLDELRRGIISFGEKNYRANQIFKWVYVKRVLDFSEMTDLPMSLRNKLGSLFRFTTMKEVERQISIDGTEKFLLKLEDDNHIETVVLKHPATSPFASLSGWMRSQLLLLCNWSQWFHKRPFCE